MPDSQYKADVALDSSGRDVAVITHKVAAINAGSSSLKFAVFDGEQRLFGGQIDGLGGRARATAYSRDGSPIDPPEFNSSRLHDTGDAVRALLPWFQTLLGNGKLDAVGHRVVHGGIKYAQPVRITPAVVSDLQDLVALAPLHQPHNIAPIEAVSELAPDLPQVACFDTAFHRSNPAVAQAFAIPYEYFELGLIRYGFHGLSYEHIARVLPAIAPQLADGRVIVAHLGNGASLCALSGGVSQASTMGFTALDGVPMGTRSGEVDPGLILYLVDQRGMSTGAISDLLYKESGMLGLSGVSADFRELERSSAPRARFAVDVFTYRVARAVGSLAAALGGLDGLVFTAGIGENAAFVREAIGRRCAWLGIEIDPQRNAVRGGPARLSTDASRTAVYAIPANEELMIARHVHSVLSQA